MIERTLAKRYAAALLAVADRENIVEDVESGLLALKEVYLADASYRAALGQPNVPKRARKILLNKPFAIRGQTTLVAFLDLLVEKNRVGLLPEIADAFDRLADATKGIVRVLVRSAWPVGAAQLETLEERLARITQKKVEVEVQVDRALKGGMLVRIGDTVIDGTVAHRLKTLRERLYELQKR